MMRLCIFLMTLFCSSAFAEALSARADRHEISLNDTFELTLESAGSTQFGKPDLHALEQDFEILSTRQVNQLNNMSGSATTHSQWLITLKPKRVGVLELPPVRLGELASRPIEITVYESIAAPVTEPIYLEVSLEHTSAYVQAQTLLTVRIYHSVSLYDDSQLSPLELEDFRIERLGEPRTYEQTLNDVLHGVIEVRYALFAQKSGRFSIPAPSFTATPVDRSQGINRPGKPVTVSADPLDLEILPKPDTFPTDQPWLPAKSISLTERFTPELNEITVGDSLTREIILQAEGLPSSALPNLSLSLPSQLKHYPDQAQLTDTAHNAGLRGQRSESEVWVATRSGDIELPPTVLYWWNTQTDQLQELKLSGRTLSIQDEALSAPEPTPIEAPAIVHPTKLWPWQLATVALFITNMLSLGLWWFARKQPAIARNAAQAGPSPRTLLDDVRKACQQQDPALARQALDAWARQYPETLAQMAARFAPLSDALDELNGALYAKTAQLWDGQVLWEAVRSLPPLPPQDGEHQDPSTLPPLYPR